MCPTGCKAQGFLLQGFKNLMEHTKWPRRDDSLPSPGALSPPSASATKAASPSTVPSVFARDEPPFPAKERGKAAGKQEKKPSPGKEGVAQNGVQKSAEEEKEEGKGGLEKPVNSTAGTLRCSNLLISFQTLDWKVGFEVSAALPPCFSCKAQQFIDSMNVTLKQGRL